MNLFLKPVFVVVSMIAFGSLSGSFLPGSVDTSIGIFSTVSADDDEYEDEDEGEDDEDDERVSRTTSSDTGAKTVTESVVEYRPVTRTVIVTEETYVSDADGDLLVDAIDPDPSVKQSEYFTDIDGDGVPNALDRHHDEDDFVFFDDSDTDDNGDGILDSYQQ